MADYDISQAFESIENELIDSMMRNFSRHRAEKTKEGYNWTQWQAEELKSFEKYRKQNASKFNKQFSQLNGKISEMLKTARADGNASQEASILQAIKNGFKAPILGSNTSTAEFFKLNDRKLNALIKSTTDDLKRAEHAVLRMSNDKYRKAIYNAQVYCNSGAGTYEKAIDMACRDMLNAGLNCVEYKNGARHTLSDYADMALKTANKRAYLRGEGEKRAEWGISTVVVNSRQGGCPKCAQYIGKVYIDDVYSNGKKSDGNYPLLSVAIQGGLFHPRCKDSTSTYYEGISECKPVSQEEMAEMERREQLEQKQQYADRQSKRFARRAKYSLDPDNKRVCSARAEEWQSRAESLSEKMSAYRGYTGNTWQKTGTKITAEEYTKLVKHAKIKGIKLVSFENFDGDVSLVHEMIDNAEKVIQDFPKLAQGKNRLQIHNSFRLSDEDLAETIGNKIFINNYAFRNRELIAKEYKKLVDEGWFVKGTDYNSIIYHELGHAIRYVYKLSPMKIAERICKENDILFFLENHLSKYSAFKLNGFEIISECFSSVYSKKSNNEFALNFFNECGKIILKRGGVL